MSDDTTTMTATAETLAEELRAEIRRGERLLDWYVKTGQKGLVPMIARDLDAARVALNTGNERWMLARRDTLRAYDE